MTDSTITGDIVERSARAQAYWEQLNCKFKDADRVFDGCIADAKSTLTDAGIDAYIENARFLGKMGRGAEPLLVYLEEAPTIASIAGEEILPEIKDFAYYLSKNTNFKAIVPFLQTLAAVTRRLQTRELLHHYFDLLKDMIEQTTLSVHGHHTT
ncbi:MAG: hypothetical protein Q9M18_04265, partial [Mariprofundaceae bacterium]|nr:hypothetical protein [Mariprofundaceae bacterium]